MMRFSHIQIILSVAGSVSATAPGDEPVDSRAFLSQFFPFHEVRSGQFRTQTQFPTPPGLLATVWNERCTHKFHEPYPEVARWAGYGSQPVAIGGVEGVLPTGMCIDLKSKAVLPPCVDCTWEVGGDTSVLRSEIRCMYPHPTGHGEAVMTYSINHPPIGEKLSAAQERLAALSAPGYHIGTKPWSIWAHERKVKKLRAVVIAERKRMDRVCSVLRFVVWPAFAAKVNPVREALLARADDEVPRLVAEEDERARRALAAAVTEQRRALASEAQRERDRLASIARHREVQRRQLPHKLAQLVREFKGASPPIMAAAAATGEGAKRTTLTFHFEGPRQWISVKSGECGLDFKAFPTLSRELGQIDALEEATEGAGCFNVPPIDHLPRFELGKPVFTGFTKHRFENSIMCGLSPHRGIAEETTQYRFPGGDDNVNNPFAALERDEGIASSDRIQYLVGEIARIICSKMEQVRALAQDIHDLYPSDSEWSRKFAYFDSE